MKFSLMPRSHNPRPPAPIQQHIFSALASSRNTPASAKCLLGDGPDLFKWAAEHGSPYDYLPEMIKKLDSPIVQVFLRPFGRPWIIVADPYEAHDIRTRRFKEFDGSNFFGETFVTLLPKMHVHMPPTGEEWKSHRKLIADTMSPALVLTQLSGRTPNAELAQGRPFDANKDILKGALDIVVGANGRERESKSDRTTYTCCPSLQEQRGIVACQRTNAILVIMSPALGIFPGDFDAGSLGRAKLKSFELKERRRKKNAGMSSHVRIA
ncbi:uncharacterized protein MYCFIDRAFT_175924 [Pseudocercospora fijiensis CIRAD86]|uniref:Cytochrome P450 n=1 Tax=Pseudocercospora fijiensis (strain CIRAD86) TaxID=383855 RepID=M2YXE3_PSEFD|nr:uncharacterized protein MYCFIDRAFT_175924 [Pseudocercospora fijiensis CIRAD86]EME82380.1 hypothetical protein MYCFIDRAFT_175924 [Pseudocercospora fijiensis CIRAD86]